MKLCHHFSLLLTHHSPLSHLSPSPPVTQHLSLHICNSTSLSLIFSLPSHFSSTSRPSLSKCNFFFSAFTQILICSLPSHLSLFLYDSASRSFSLPCSLSLTLQARSHRDQREEKLTPTHISSLYFFLSF